MLEGFSQYKYKHLYFYLQNEGKMSPKDAELVLQGLDSGKLIKEGLYFLGNFYLATYVGTDYILMTNGTSSELCIWRENEKELKVIVQWWKNQVEAAAGRGMLIEQLKIYQRV